MEHFANNLARLLGLHRLTAREAADMLAMSRSALTKWATGDRRPSFTAALVVGDFFGVPADRLARADFADLLEHELADPQRFREVEAEIRRRRSTLRAVGEGEQVFGKSKRVLKMAEAEEAQAERRRKTKAG
jgi:transcriptional regulator with XRE-family HTH domain